MRSQWRSPAWSACRLNCADRQQRAAVHRVKIRQVREGDPEILRSLAAMTIDLTARELSDILQGLDDDIERMADWSDDELTTARDRRNMRRKTRKYGCLVKKLIVYEPNHYMEVSAKGASRGSGATVTLNGTELDRNGGKPVATKLTNNGAGTYPPAPCPEPPLEGGRRGVSGGSRDGISGFSGISIRPYRKDPQRWTLRIALLARGLSFVSSSRPEARRNHHAAWCVSGMSLLP